MTTPVSARAIGRSSRSRAGWTQASRWTPSPNLALRRNGSIVTNERAALVHDLDSLPWRDNSPGKSHEDDSLEENYGVLTDRTGDLPDDYIAGMPLFLRIAAKPR